ncbi:MAG: dihydropteroate synthase, partial [Candidatus Zixiibacteriota bacterium]
MALARDRWLDFTDIQVMAVINVTPDSFSDGGRFLNTGDAIDHARQVVEEGADIIDVGGESSRPGSEPVSR